MDYKLTLLTAVQDFCAQQGFDKTYWVALSGGLDSQVLLSLLHTLKQTHALKVRAIHVNHGLSPHAQDWQQVCRQTCASYQIELVERAGQWAHAAGDSLEAAARDHRYQQIAACLNEGDIVLTAHHQDDQAETLLLQLLRGAGPKGLAAMPAIKPFSRGLLGRPLLAFSRQMLSQYAREQQLQWVEDESNENTAFTRNFIRHEVLPVLNTRWPSAAATLSRSAEHCAEVNVLLEEYLADDCLQAKGTTEQTLSVKALLSLSPNRQRQVLRYWIQQSGHPLPDTKKLTTIQHDVLSAAWDAMPCVQWGDVELRRYRDDLHLMPCLSAPPPPQTLVWDFSSALSLVGIGNLHASRAKGRGLKAELTNVTVSLRNDGDQVRLPGRNGHRSLKQLFQTHGIPPWERYRTPLIFAEDQLISILGYFIDVNYRATPEEEGWVIAKNGVASPQATRSQRML